VKRGSLPGYLQPTEATIDKGTHRRPSNDVARETRATAARFNTPHGAEPKSPAGGSNIVSPIVTCVTIIDFHRQVKAPERGRQIKKVEHLDKGQGDTLIEALGLRNRRGNPTKYRPGANKARRFIEDIANIVFT